jgi:hypothetical protein
MLPILGLFPNTESDHGWQYAQGQDLDARHGWQPYLYSDDKFLYLTLFL